MKRSGLEGGLVSVFLLAPLITFVFAIAGVEPARAASDKVLQRVKGAIGYQQDTNATFTRVIGKFVLPDDYLVVTRQKSAAYLTLPDSSIVGIGQSTSVQVGAFNETVDGPGSTVTVNNGTLRFDIRRPTGATANYHFNTPTTQIAVRGTVGLLSFIGGNTTVACLACAADSVSVTVGTQGFTLLTGQVLTVSAAGVVTTAAMTASVLSGFSAAGVSTAAVSGPAAAVAGVATAVTAGTTAAIAGGAAAIGAAAAAASSSSNNTQSSASCPSPITSTPVTVASHARFPSSTTCPGPTATSVPVQLQGHPAPPTAPGGQRRGP